MIIIEASYSQDWPTFISKVMTSQKLNLWKYGVDKHIQKEKDEKCPIAKISLFVQISG